MIASHCELLILEKYFSKDFLGWEEGEAKRYSYDDMKNLYQDKSLFMGVRYAWTTLQMEMTGDIVGVFGVFTMLNEKRPGEKFSPTRHLSQQHHWLTQYFRREGGKWKLWRQVVHKLPGDSHPVPYPWRIYDEKLSKIELKSGEDKVIDYVIRLISSFR